MNKKKLIVAVIAILIPLFASAEEVIINGINYELNRQERTAIVKSWWNESDGRSYYSGSIVIPSEVIYDNTTFNVISIGVAFSDCFELTSVTLPNSIVSIEPNAFFRCSELQSVTIPNSIITIGEDAFADCISLTSIEIPNSVTSIGTDAFNGCSKLTTINIPDNLSNIDIRTFSGCVSLTTIDIPSSVTSIGFGAFYNCSSLTSLTLPNGDMTIGPRAFWGCTGLKNVYCLNGVPKTVEDNNEYCFKEDDVRNTTLHVHDDKEYYYVVCLGWYPWSYFEKVTYAESGYIYFGLYYNVDGQPYKSYSYYPGEKIIPEPYPEKEGYDFSGWDNLPEEMPFRDWHVNGYFKLAEVILDGVTYQIKNDEAHIINCIKTSGDIVVHSAVEYHGHQYPVKTIPSDIFNGKAFTSLTIQNGIETIEAKAFYGCSNIVSVILPSTITSIGERAFANFDNLETFTCKATTIPNTHRTAFENSYTADYVDLYVPQESVEAYNTTAPWKDFKSVNGMVITKYTLTYLVDNEPYKTYQYEEGDPITPEPAPARDGYTFSGWSDIPATMPASDVTVTGTFTKLKCATPTIALTSGKLVFSCDTPDVEYHYSITSSGAASGIGNEIPLSSTYTVTVYATRENYDDSDPATMELQLSQGDLNGDGSLSISDAVTLIQMILNKTE